MVEKSATESLGSVVNAVVELSRRVIETYRIDPRLIEEHANGERRIFQGGYGDRQLFELVQNGADELRSRHGGKIAVILTEDRLYVANEGSPFTARGVDTILRMGVSSKRGGEIGRFGVGVKSVLSVTDAPEFFSTTGSFKFDREWSADRIAEVYPLADRRQTPVLRMARPVDLSESTVDDPVLKELMTWASTVVRLPLKVGAAVRLGADLRSFPRQFPIFAPHVGIVQFKDLREGYRLEAELRASREGDVHTVEFRAPAGMGGIERWRVFTRSHVPSAKARQDAGELHDRTEVDVSWAVPLDNARPRGAFWAFFPTKYVTTLRGILNAPWKTSEDRQNLFDGNDFNHELIAAAAELIVDSLPQLASSEDPAAYFPLVPARGREAAQWADHELTEKFYEVAAVRPSLPDQLGLLRMPRTLNMHPPGLKLVWLEMWAEYEGRPVDWCHHSVEQRERRPRALMIRGEAATATVREWLEALVADGKPESSARAIKILAGMKDDLGVLDRSEGNKGAGYRDAMKARVVLTDLGLVAVETADGTRTPLFQRSDGEGLTDTLTYVSDAVADFDEETRSALEHLGIPRANPRGRLQSVVEQGFAGYSDTQWTALWELIRAAGHSAAADVLHRGGVLDPHIVRVKTVDGHFRQAARCLVPGAVVPFDGSRDRSCTVDIKGFHRDDRLILERLGVADKPRLRSDARQDPWFADYAETALQAVRRHLPAGSAPTIGDLHFEGGDCAGPLGLLADLSKEGVAAFTHHIPAAGVEASWTAQVGVRGSRLKIVSPLVWMVRRHDWFRTGRGIRRLKDVVGPALEEYEGVLPVAAVSEALAEALEMPATLDAVPRHLWRETLERLESDTDDEAAGRVYALILQAGDWFPEDVATRCRVGGSWTTRPDDEIVATADRAQFATLVRESVPALLAPSDEDAERMRSAWGMKRFEQVVKRELRFAAITEPMNLYTEFPYLKVRFGSKYAELSYQVCREIEHIVRKPGGLSSEPLDHAVNDTVVLVRETEDDLGLLMSVDRALKWRLGREGCAAILAQREAARGDARLRKARDAEDLAEKLAILVDAGTLRSGLPQGLYESEDSYDLPAESPIRIAKLAIDAYDDGVLRQYKDSLGEAAGELRGSQKSRQYVAYLGFPESFAGAKAAVPPQVETVDGPTMYPALHEYQTRIVTAMAKLLDKRVPGRAMLCLPTGAGKTRVAAEAVIQAFREGAIHGPVLWIAQTAELCEQAVQSWKFVWSKVGPEQSLTISRLWTTNEATPVTSSPHLVVATDAKLEKCLNTPDYAWLRNPFVVLVDEAHSSLSPRYTEIFKLLGLTTFVTRRPLIGLTATPYRGFNEDETRRLVERYGANRLDDGIFEGDPYNALQALGVLSKVEHEELAGAELTLSASELDQVAMLGALPSTAEYRLARDENRNKAILNAIGGFPSDWPILLFATSVEHARLLSARLNGMGVRSTSVDATTPAADRRARIEQFRSGTIRVLSNYGVLAQGFDAPATRAVIVARPTYSPNMYQQMIGRGLRGPRNGGKDTCLILNVRDNITNYGKELAFTGFEHLWRTGD